MLGIEKIVEMKKEEIFWRKFATNKRASLFCVVDKIIIALVVLLPAVAENFN